MFNENDADQTDWTLFEDNCSRDAAAGVLDYARQALDGTDFSITSLIYLSIYKVQHLLGNITNKTLYAVYILDIDHGSPPFWQLIGGDLDAVFGLRICK